MGDLSDITLTDDEAVVVAVEAGQAWPSALPTVDVRNEHALTSAALRGWRSLSVRDMTETVPSLVDRLRPLFAAGVTAQTYLANSDLARLPGPPKSYFYRTPELACIVELTTGAGVHHFRTMPAAMVEQMLVSAINGAHAEGMTPADGETSTDARFFCVTTNRADHIRLLAVSRGRLAMYRLTDAVAVLPAPRSAAEAVRLLDLAADNAAVTVP